jgi:UDP-N-acetylmuramyl pentapeptide phosphotransferase/UDP-N-acetylglucosamine-1-phosphate transferase
MNWLALLGLLLIVYALFVIYLTVKKPEGIWNMAKIRMFRKVLGEKGTVIFFWIIAAACTGVGIWLLVR